MHKIELLYLIVISALFLSYIVTVTYMRHKVVNFGDINFCVDIPNPLNPTMQICMLCCSDGSYLSSIRFNKQHLECDC